MENSIELKVHLAQDEESGRWYIAESDIPGLWLEADDPSALIARIRDAAPEMIQLNMAEIDAAAERGSKPTEPRAARPRIKPVFDSPVELAYC